MQPSTQLALTTSYKAVSSVRHLDKGILEVGVVPGGGGMCDHNERRVVKLVVLDIQEDQLGPVLELLAHADEAWDVDACAEQLQMLHQLLRLVLSV